jgi:transcriptional regulator with XRE-family HTH domain
MTIHPEALRAARLKAGLSQQALAERCSRPGSRNFSQKAIYRYEKGTSKPSRKKAQWLADGLGTTIEKLSTKPEDDAATEASLRDQGYVWIRALLSPDVIGNYRLVVHHYGVSATDLIDAAPWMFTLLAEMSLAERKERRADAATALGEAIDRLPTHLCHGRVGAHDFENVFEDEKASIAKRDIFGKTVLETNIDFAPFDPDEANPFVDFLRRTAKKISSAEIKDEDCTILSGDLPEWPVFTAWLDELTGKDWLASHAIQKRHVQLGAIPPELLGAEKRTERVAWLIARIPAEERERLVAEHDAPPRASLRDLLR